MSQDVELGLNIKIFNDKGMKVDLGKFKVTTTIHKFSGPRYEIQTSGWQLVMI